MVPTASRPTTRIRRGHGISLFDNLKLRLKTLWKEPMVAAGWCACPVWESQVGMRHAHRVSLDSTMTTTALKFPPENADGGTRAGVGVMIFRVVTYFVLSVFEFEPTW